MRFIKRFWFNQWRYFISYFINKKFQTLLSSTLTWTILYKLFKNNNNLNSFLMNCQCPMKTLFRTWSCPARCIIKFRMKLMRFKRSLMSNWILGRWWNNQRNRRSRIKRWVRRNLQKQKKKITSKIWTIISSHLTRNQSRRWCLTQKMIKSHKVILNKPHNPNPSTRNPPRRPANTQTYKTSSKLTYRTNPTNTLHNSSFRSHKNSS